MGIKRYFGLLAAGVTLALATGANTCVAGLSGGDEDGNWSWSTTSDNNQFLLVVLNPSPLEDQLAFINECYWEDEAERMSTIAETRHLEATYPASGVYLNDGSASPLWTYDGRLGGGRLSPDGTRVVSVCSDYFFCVRVIDKQGVRVFTAPDILGYLPTACHVASGEGLPWVDDWLFDPNDPSWNRLTIVWETGAQSIVRLDDLTVVQSNTTRYALRSLVSTPQGIAALLIVLAIFAFLAWLLMHLFSKTTRKRSA